MQTVRHQSCCRTVIYMLLCVPLLDFLSKAAVTDGVICIFSCTFKIIDRFHLTSAEKKHTIVSIVGAWLSLVECYIGVVEVARSNRVVPIKKPAGLCVSSVRSAGFLYSLYCCIAIVDSLRFCWFLISDAMSDITSE